MIAALVPLVFLIVPTGGEESPRQSEVSILHVRAIDAVGHLTRRYSVSFTFEILAVDRLAAGRAERWAVGDMLHFTMFQGADWDAKVREDAIGWLLHFLRAQEQPATSPYLEVRYSFGETRPLHLGVRHGLRSAIEAGGMFGVWTLTNADGATVSVNTSKKAH